MNAEKKEQLWILGKLAAIAACTMLYAWGGMEYKVLRRFVAPAIAVLTMMGYTRSWKTLVQYPIWCVTLSMGYGADSLIGKITRRGVFGLSNGASSSTNEILINRKWSIIIFQLLLLPALYITFGVLNPFGSARIEETVMGLFMFGLPILTARRQK